MNKRYDDTRRMGSERDRYEPRRGNAISDRERYRLGGPGDGSYGGWSGMDRFENERDARGRDQTDRDRIHQTEQIARGGPRDAGREQVLHGRAGYGVTTANRGDFGRDGRSPTPPRRTVKGYRRSDERVREDVCEMLGAADDIDPTDIEVAVSNGEVTLTGTVSERRMKLIAEELTERINGVNEIHNLLRVKRDEPGSAVAQREGQPVGGTGRERQGPPTTRPGDTSSGRMAR